MTSLASAYTPSPEWSAFRDYPGNPLGIEPHWPEWIIADPTVLSPEVTPDGRWHLFANGLQGDVPLHERGRLDLDTPGLTLCSAGCGRAYGA